VPAERRQQQLRGELGEADVAEMERRAGALVDLPAQGDLLHLQADQEDEVSRQVVAEARDPESGVGVVRLQRRRLV
jgi:hypothetical protein